MILEPGSPRRLGIYFFYDADGIVDDYVPHFLRSMRDDLSSLVVVCNGKLSPEGRRTFESLDAVVITRENRGFDVWAYKTALDHVGWDTLVEFDEVVMMNFTIMGPVNSFAEMYAEMGSRDLDFWGITVHNGATFDPWGAFEDGRIPLHLQSHFVAVRGGMLRSPEFKSYWDDMVEIRSYQDAVAKHEARFTPYFADRGFVWDTYVDTRDLDDVMFYPLFNVPVELIENRRCPIFKRKSFFATPDMYLGENGNDIARGLFDYLRDSGRYDPSLLVPHLLRTSTQYELRSALNLFRVVAPAEPGAEWPALRAALVVDGRPDRALDDRLARARAVADHVSVFVAGEAQPGFASLADAADAAEGAFSIAADFDIVGILAALGEEAYPGSITVATAKHGYDAVAADPLTVLSILDWFDRDPYLGMAVPSPTVHSASLGAIGRASESLGGDLGGREMLDDLGMLDAIGAESVRDPDSGDAFPPSFWFRSAALTTAREPDGTMATTLAGRTGARLAHLLPLLAQAAGYYTSHVLSMHQADATLTNLYHVARSVNRAAGHIGDDLGSLSFRAGAGVHQLRAQRPADTVMTMYWDFGDGLSEISSSRAVPVRKRGRLEVEWTVPEGAVGARFDPIEGYGCAVTGIRVVSPSDTAVVPENGIRAGRIDVFEDEDPNYSVQGVLRPGKPLRLRMDDFRPFPSGWGLGPLLLGGYATTAGGNA